MKTYVHLLIYVVATTAIKRNKQKITDRETLNRNNIKSKPKRQTKLEKKVDYIRKQIGKSIEIKSRISEKNASNIQNIVELEKHHKSN